RRVVAPSLPNRASFVAQLSIRERWLCQFRRRTDSLRTPGALAEQVCPETVRRDASPCGLFAERRAAIPVTPHLLDRTRVQRQRNFLSLPAPRPSICRDLTTAA